VEHILNESQCAPHHLTHWAHVSDMTITYPPDIATVPFTVLERAAKRPLTDRGIETFLQDWRQFVEQTSGKRV
jgi:transaldolase